MFESIIGHAENKRVLEEQIKNKSTLHSYLFAGRKGIGKKLVALEFAKNLLGVSNLSASADFKYISKLEGKKDIVIEQVRDAIIDDIHIIPSSGDKKVYIIDDAENLNVAAQNALLKTLEEPPSYAVIILIASSVDSFLPTIISRLSVMNFSKLSNDELSSYIKNNYKSTFNEKYIDFFDGSIGQATEVLTSGTAEKLADVDKLVGLINQKNELEALKKASHIDFNNKNLLDYFEYTLYENGCYFATFIVEKSAQRLKYNGNYDIVIDNMILKIINKV